MLDLLISLPVLADKDEQRQDIIASEQYKENLKAYPAQFKSDRSTRYTILTYMHDDLLGEFERYPTTKHMWAGLKIMFE